MTSNEKYNVLTEILGACGSLAVAFSGGVDSTFLLKAAHNALGARVLAVTVSSPLFPEGETDFASEFCRREGIRHEIIPVDHLSVEGFTENTPERCYICKKALMSELLRTARRHRIETVAEGSNLDDDGDYRPGARAVRELGIRSPLREAKLSKAEIRVLSRGFGLETADKPSLACLASRFPYGETITEPGLLAVGAAERYLRELGFSQVRVRMHGSLARIETDRDSFPLLSDTALRENIYARLRTLGFSYIALDLLGYRTGSMNEIM